VPWIPPTDPADEPTEVTPGGEPGEPPLRDDPTAPSGSGAEITMEPTGSPELRPGAQLDRYRILRKLAQGGMAEVYLARAVGIEGFEKLVVVKRILPHLAGNAMFIEMFLSEARLAAVLDHPNIGQVFDLGRDGSDYYFVMEYVRGQSLHSVLKSAHRQARMLDPAQALGVSIGVAAALQHAHEAVGVDGLPLGIVHRDISPGNVLVTPAGHVKVIDFGIARAVNHTSVTKDGTRKGKLSYMSPEQCLGLEIDHRSDIFSLGILLFEVTTMTRLFRADNELEVVNQIAYADVPHPSTFVQGYPPELERIVLRALARRPDERYESARDLLADLEQLAWDYRLATSPTTLAHLMDSLFYRRSSSSSHPRAGLGG
jgi:serine/threonine protein kinase